MRQFLVFVILLLFFSSYLFADEEFDNSLSDNRLSKIVLGLNLSYVNYKNLENDIGLSIDDNKFLIGINFGFISKGIFIDFIYAYKVFPFIQSKLGNFKVIDYFDFFMFRSGYLFTVFENYFYLGPSIVLSYDGSTLKFFDDIDFYSSSWEVKEISSKAFSIGGGISLTFFRNVFVSGYYFYSFSNRYYYQGVYVMNSPTFNPSGFRVVFTLSL